MRMCAKDGGALSDSGCPTSWRQGNERQFGHGATRASQTTQAFNHGRRLEVIPSKRASGTVRVRWDVVEVGVLTMAVVEVDVLARSRVDGRGYRDLGEGSGTCRSG